MRTETTTQHFKTTRYVCEAEGCDFSTTDEREAEEHPWRKHKVFKKVRVDIDPDDELRTESTLVLFDTEEAFEHYQNLDGFVDRLYADPWEGPGWYETWSDSVPCGHGCCTKWALFIRPASKTVEALKKAREEIDHALEKLGQMEATDVVG